MTFCSKKKKTTNLLDILPPSKNLPLGDVVLVSLRADTSLDGTRCIMFCCFNSLRGVLILIHCLS